MKVIIHLIVLMLISSCANYSSLSKNLVKRGDLALQGGVAQNKVWNESLNFTRVSWFHELTLYFDTLYIRIMPSSPFYSWFSKSEIERVNKCNDFFITLNYSMDSEKLSRKDFVAQMEEQQYKEILLPKFGKRLKSHPDIEEFSLQLYDVQGFCLKKAEIKGPPEVDFPGFKLVKLK